MATIKELDLLQNADQTVQIDIFTPGTPPPGVPFDLTGLEVDFYIKTSQSTPDSDPSTVKLTSLTSAITLSTPPGGSVKCRATVSIARANVPNALPNGFWRCDVVGGVPQTKVPCGYGPAPVTAQ